MKFLLLHSFWKHFLYLEQVRFEKKKSQRDKNEQHFVIEGVVFQSFTFYPPFFYNIQTRNHIDASV